MTETQQVAQEVSNNPWFERGVRVGLFAYGVMHLVIAWLALQLAFGERSGAPSQQGAMHELAQKPFGSALLWIVALGFVFLAAWQLIEALVGHRKHDEKKRAFKRAGSAGKVVIYLVFAFTAVRTAIGQDSKSGEDHLTAEIMKLPLGQLLVGLAGASIVAIGGYLVYRGFSRSFEDDLQPGATSGSTGTAAVRLAQIGYPAKGIALGVIGLLFIVAAVNFDPNKAGGLDVALRTLLDQPLGPWILGAVAIGFGCFGVYCFFRAKYADTSA